MIQCNLGKIWKAHPPTYPKNVFPEIFHFVINFCVVHLVKNIRELSLSLWHPWFSKGTQPFDFIQRNVIRKSTYKVKNSQINGGLIMFFGISRISFLKICWLNCEQNGKNQYNKKEHNQHSCVFKVLR